MVNGSDDEKKICYRFLNALLIYDADITYVVRQGPLLYRGCAASVENVVFGAYAIR